MPIAQARADNRDAPQANLILMDIIPEEETSLEETNSSQEKFETAAMAVTRAKAKLQGPLDWDDQRKIRVKVTEKIQKEQKEKEKVSDKDDQKMDDFFQELLNTPMHITIGQLLDTVPLFKEKMMQKLGKNHVEVKVSEVYGLEPEDVDFTIPTITVDFQGDQIGGVLLDGGSGVNILPESEFLKLGKVTLDPAPFQVKMADQRRIQPLGILRRQEVSVAGLSFKANFVVLKIPSKCGSYPMLLGRPWFRTTKLKQDWETDEVVLKQGKKSIKIKMGSSVKLDKSAKPLYAQSIQLADEITDDEEDLFLQSNPTVVPIFEVQIAELMDRYWSTGIMEVEGLTEENPPIEESECSITRIRKEDLTSQELKVDGRESEIDMEEAVKQAETLYKNTLEKIVRVKEDDLQDLNLGTEADPKIVKVSTDIDDAFKTALWKLLKEFKDIFCMGLFGYARHGSGNMPTSD